MSLDFSNTGYVYILTNESLGNLIKIGYTKNSPEERANELYTTGVPTPYRVWSYQLVENANAVEEEVHVALFKNRSNRDREFFCISPDEAKKVVDRIILEQREDFLKNGKRKKQEQYSNPKFVEFIKFLKQNQGKLFSDDEIAKELKISQKGVAGLVYMMESQETTVLYVNPDPKQHKKYGIYVKFGEEQLNILDKKYPNLDFSEVKGLFEKKKTFNNSNKASNFANNKPQAQNQGQEQKQQKSSKFNPLDYNNPKFIELIKVLKNNQGKKMLTAQELAENINKESKETSPIKISADGVRKIINLLENHQFDIVFIVPKTDKQDERFGIDFKFDLQRLKELDKAYPKMNLSQLEGLFEQKEKQQQLQRQDAKNLEKSLEKIQQREETAAPKKESSAEKKPFVPRMARKKNVSDKNGINFRF